GPPTGARRWRSRVPAVLAVAPFLPVGVFLALDRAGCRGWGTDGPPQPVCPGGPAAGWAYVPTADVSFAMLWLSPLVALWVVAMIAAAADLS
ncbi:MAG TPA: hypothetical protein PLL33_14395, partial [Paracoccus sp. (in: a-proteobacteria)]|nr:hypothetical protein [Paracoccus sp. (in: a-proteobacteria)]